MRVIGDRRPKTAAAGPGKRRAVRWSVDGRSILINAGEWSLSRGGYLNDEWLTPRFVYMKHQCDGCHYPPSMCCLQSDECEDPYDGNYDALEEALFAMPRVAAVAIEEWHGNAVGNHFQT